MTINSLTISHITLAINCLQTSFEFYHSVLGFKPLCRWDKGAYFLAGDLWFCLSLDKTRQPNACYTHYAFYVPASQFSAAVARLRQHHVTCFKSNQSPGDSFYFFDPDQHKLELHSGTWQDRLHAKRADPGSWREVVWYADQD